MGKIIKGDNTGSHTIKHSDNNGAAVGKTNKNRQVFNVQSGNSKPYDTNNMVKQPENK